MATNYIANVSPDFNLDTFVNDLTQAYIAKGFSVRTTKLNDGAQLVFDKNCGGINMLLGMGLGITATITVNNGVLNIVYTNEEWTGKIIGLVVGWFICMIPFITAIIGAVQQMDLSKNINNVAAALIAKA